MVEYKSLTLSNQQLDKLKDAVKSNNGSTLRIGNKNFSKADLIHELFLTQAQLNKLINKVEKNMSTDIKLSKAQINGIIKHGGALGSILARFLPKLIKPAISLRKNVLAPLGLSAPKLIKPAISLRKNVLAPLGLSAAMSPTDVAIQKKKKICTELVLKL